MGYNLKLADRIRKKLPRGKVFEEKKMFGGVGYLLNGNMCVGIWKESLIARLGPEGGEKALQEPFVKEFDITGRPMKGWVMVLREAIEDDDQLSGWIYLAVNFVGKLPKKQKSADADR